MSDTQPEIGDRVTYIDNDGEYHRALVVDACEGDPYITCVTGWSGPLGKEYNHATNDHSSTFPHVSISDEPHAMETTAFIPGWDAADGYPAGTPEAEAE